MTVASTLGTMEILQGVSHRGNGPTMRVKSRVEQWQFNNITKVDRDTFL